MLASKFCIIYNFQIKRNPPQNYILGYWKYVFHKIKTQFLLRFQRPTTFY